MKEKRFFGYYAVAGVFIIMFSHIGAAGTFGVFFAQMVADTQLPVTQLLYMSTIGTIVGCLVSIFGANLIGKIGARTSLIIGTFCCCGNMLLCSFAHTIPVFYLAGVINGLLIGFGMHSPASMVVADWFIKDRKKILGVVFAAVGFGGGIWILVAGQLIARIGWRSTYQVMAALIFVVNILCEIFLIKSCEQMGQKPLGWDDLADGADAAHAMDKLEGISLKQAVKTPSFYLVLIGIMLISMLVAGYKTFSPSMMQSYGVANQVTSYYMAALTFASGITTLIAGNIANKTKPSIYVGGLVLFYVISAVVLVVWAHSGATSLALVLVSLFFCALAYPITNNVPSTVMGDVIGPRYFSQFATLVVAANFGGQIFVGPILNFVLAKTGDMANLYYVLSALGVLGFIFIVLAMRMKTTQKALLHNSIS